MAVVSRAVLQGWTAELQAAGIEAAAIYPDISLLPQNPGQTVLWLENSCLSVRRPGMLPFAVELTPVTEALVVAGVIPDPLASETLTVDMRAAVLENAILYVTREDWETVQDEIEAVLDRFASLRIQLLPDGPLPWLAHGLEATDAVNLLQGEFARTTDYGAPLAPLADSRHPRRRPAGGSCGGRSLRASPAKRDTAALDTEIAQLFAAAMPADPMQDPRRQMQMRLDRIRHSGPGPQQFLRTLSTLAEALSATPKTSIDSMSYHEDSLEMKLTAPSLAALSQLSQLVGKKGLSADIESSTPLGSGIEAHMRVHTQASKAHR